MRTNVPPHKTIQSCDWLQASSLQNRTKVQAFPHQQTAISVRKESAELFQTKIQNSWPLIKHYPFEVLTRFKCLFNFYLLKF